MMKRGIVFGSFDLLHAGHIILLSAATEQCDTLIVALQSDPTIDRPGNKNKPIQSLYERWLQLVALDSVDEIVVYSHESDIVPILMNLDPNIRFLGDDYVDKDFTGKEYCEKHGIELSYIDRSHGYSTTELRRRIKESK